MSGVRKHFWEVVVSGAGGGSRSRKYGICGCMPALVRSVERSSGRGTRGHDGSRRWPFSSKNERKPSRSSADVFTRLSLGAGALPFGAGERTHLEHDGSRSPEHL